MKKVFIGIGSNIEPKKNLKTVILLLQEKFDCIIFSPVYKTSAVGFQGDDFLNMVAVIETEHMPDQILEILREIEKGMGHCRKTTSGYCSRIIDLDLLLFGEDSYSMNGIDLPRPGMTDFAYILKPLQDLVPDMIHCGTDISYSDMWKGFADKEQLIETVCFEKW